MRRLLAVAVVLLFATAAGAMSAGSKPTGDPAGVKLLERVLRSYEGVPAVSIKGTLNTLHARFTEVLRRTTVVAEEVVVTTGKKRSLAVKRLGSPTFIRKAGSACWRKAAASQELGDVGNRFLTGYRTHVGRPTRQATRWVLPVVLQDSSGTKGALTYLVDVKSNLVTSVIASLGVNKVLEKVRSLQAAPKLAVTKPRC